MGRIYVIEAPDGLTLVDASAPGALPQIKKDLQKSGHTLNDVKRILITHAHGDHYGSLAALYEVTGARVYAHHRHESAVIRGEKLPIYPPSSQFKGFDRFVSKYWIRPMLQYRLAVPVEYELKEGDRLDEVLPGLEVVDLAGHSPGQCGFWHAELGLLIGGDVMMHFPTGHLMLPLVTATHDLEQAKRTIHKVAEMNVRTLCVGHGKPCIENAAPMIRNIAKKLR